MKFVHYPAQPSDTCWVNTEGKEDEEDEDKNVDDGLTTQKIGKVIHKMSGC